MVTLDEAGRDAPPLRRPASDSPLAPFVEMAWLQPGRPRAGAAERRRIVPDPSAHVVVAACGGGRARAALVGARTRFCDVEARRLFTLGVRLRPGVLPRLTGLPASDFTDRSVALADLLPGAAGVTDAAAAGDAERALALALGLLAARLRDADPVDWRVAALEVAWRREAGPAPEVGELARRLGVAGRTLRATAAAHVGLSPARWRRVRRLHAALEQALKGRTAGGWARVAGAAGYHDQPHLVRGFRDLLGEPPSAFLRRRSGAGPYKTAPGGRASLREARPS